MSRRISVVMVAWAACAAAALPAGAAPTRHRHLWATVNICDTERHPNMMGVRASMPGDGSRRTRMFMRFHAQYFDNDRQAWEPVASHGVSNWVYVGTGRYNHTGGWTFTFNPPTVGSSYLLRGVVDLQWRRRVRVNGRLRTVVVRKARVRTRGGIGNTRDADPPGYSKATCTIS